MNSPGRKVAARPSKPAFRCEECGWSAAKWVGRCAECQAWGTVMEVGAVAAPRTTASPAKRPAQPIGDIAVETARTKPTGVEEFDRVLGGGLVPGAVVLLAGEPGVGKSTLLLDVAGRAARGGRRVLYITGEESAAQVRLRAERIDAMAESLYLTAESDLGTALGQIDQIEPDLLVVDSVQTIASAQVDGTAGGVTQVREVAGALIAVAKERDIAVLLVGHVTKDGSIAGPRVLEHLVDVVCQFEGERTSRLRFVRAIKNRYGPTDEVGCFDLSDSGIAGLRDPSGLFLSHSPKFVPGTAVTVTVEGRRPLAVELQALVEPSALTNPRRATSGIDSSRLSMILAVLSSRAGTPTAGQDVYTSTVGGARVLEPAADLAVALAVVSARRGEPLQPRLAVFGEVGLSGEVRPVPGIARRLSEAYRLGFTEAIAPRGTIEETTVPEGMKVTEVLDVAEAIEASKVRLNELAEELSNIERYS